MLQEDMQKERRLKRKILELKQTIRVLICVLLVFVLATTALAILLVWSSFKETSFAIEEETGRFEGEHRVEQYTINCGYKSKIDEEAGAYYYITDVLKFAGEGYEKVAATVEEYYSVGDLSEYMASRYELFSGGYYRETVRLECARMDDTVVSIKRLVRFAEGTGFFVQDGKTFSVKTGKLLERDDLLKDKKGFYGVIDELILAQLPLTYPVITDSCPDYKEIYQEYFIENEKLPEWHLEEDGIAFSFIDLQFLSRGEALPCMMVVVPYEQVMAYLKPEYTVQGE